MLFGVNGEAVRDDKPLMIFPYGVSRNKIERAISNLRVNAVDRPQLGRCRRRAHAQDARTQGVEPKLKAIAAENVPIYSIKTNTTTQIQAALRDVFNLARIDIEEIAMREAEEAIYQVLLDEPGDRALTADVVRAPHAASARRTLPPAVAQHRARTEPPRPHLQVRVD